MPRLECGTCGQNVGASDASQHRRGCSEMPTRPALPGQTPGRAVFQPAVPASPVLLE